LRKDRYSYDNIIEKKAFTINIPSENYANAADYFGIATGSKTNKFADTGLTPVKSDLVDAPYVKEFPLILECKMTHKTEIGIHTIFVGEIVDVKADESVLGENGLPDINKVLPVLFAPEVRTYHGIGKTLGKAFSMGKEIQQK
jgi:flavin reductase (DIM6/NTAB) family NADH-FMN oxidoreductase RutF